MAVSKRADHSSGIMRSYLPAERQDMILSLLTRQNVATVPELAELLNTTEITVRRDLAALSDAGLLRRIRGGAMSLGDAAVPRPVSHPTGAEHAAVGSASAEKGGRIASSGIGSGDAFRGEAATVADILDGSDAESVHAESLSDLPESISSTFDWEHGSHGEPPTVGVMLPEPSFLWPRVIDHLRLLAEQLGLRISTRESAYEIDIHEESLLDELAQEPGICGLIVAPNAHPEFGGRTWDWIGRAAVPVVVVERDQPLLSPCFVDSVRTNHHYGVRKAAVHFIEHGHTRIGAAFTETPTSHAIAEGWRQVVEGSGVIDCPLTIDGIPPYDSKGVSGIVDRIIDTGVTAMLIHSDYLAIAIAQLLERRGKRVPEDVSLISIDGFTTPSSRPLTVLRSREEDMADAMLNTLLDRIRHPQASTRHIFVDPVMIDRGSVADLR